VEKEEEWEEYQDPTTGIMQWKNKKSGVISRNKGGADVYVLPGVALGSAKEAGRVGISKENQYNGPEDAMGLQADKITPVRPKEKQPEKETRSHAIDYSPVKTSTSRTGDESQDTRR